MNGAGKSTLIKLANLINQDSGQVYDNENLPIELNTQDSMI